MEQSGRAKDSIASYRRALAIRPDYVAAHHHLGNALRRQGWFEESAESHRRAIALRPDFIEAYRGLASTYSEIGNQQEVIACRRKVVELDPGSAVAHSDLLLALHYPAGISQESLFDEARRWEARHARHLYPTNPRPRRAIGGKRPLRIGYVSADFREHPVARFMLPLLATHDPSRFYTYCYSDTRVPDELTNQLRSRAQVWHDTASLTDEQLALQIAADSIDILVDLGGHMGGNRLLVFARRPAPVQVTMFNYPDTTGLATVDYRMSDPYSDPPGTDRFYTERLRRLPSCAWCYDPGLAPEVCPPPILRNGFVTFGCLNNPLKVGPAVVALWSRILHAVPASRLMLLGAGANATHSHFEAIFHNHGINRARLIFVPKQSRTKYLEQLDDIDIALDPFPYNGGVTSCDALCMGIPLITLIGNSYRARQGYMLLSTMGLKELAAHTGHDYVQHAIRLAARIDKLQALRLRLRTVFRRSAIMDPHGFPPALMAASQEG